MGSGLRSSLLLLPLFLCACHLAQPTQQEEYRYSGGAFQFRFTILHRMIGSDGILWRMDPTNCPFDLHKAEQVIESALARWNVPGACSFRRAEEGETATLTIGWRGTNHRSSCVSFGISAEMLAHIAAAPRSGDDTPWSIHLNTNLDWTLGKPTSKPTLKPTPAARGLRAIRSIEPQLEKVIVHEAGHILGLGHVPLKSSVMHPVHPEARATPGELDLDGIHSLYGSDAAAASDDLEICCVDPQGKPHRAAPTIRGVAPAGRVRVHLFDIDDDGKEEMVLLGVGYPTDGSGLLVLDFGSGAVLERTTGPFPGMLGGNLPLAVGRVSNGDRVLAQQPNRPQGGYHAVVYLGQTRQLRALSEGEKWYPLVGGGGGGDEDGDGELDQAIVGIVEEGLADLDGDGIDELVRRGPADPQP
ncbi:MAG TPA: matrixin family metalloprotease [Planctomycetes bacterium]|nr:matrixin family metalloprotease [Planctomycetota bacterium]HIK82441.1 matrixin family metalloprotease [Planctomycetota bacterium]